MDEINRGGPPRSQQKSRLGLDNLLDPEVVSRSRIQDHLDRQEKSGRVGIVLDFSKCFLAKFEEIGPKASGIVEDSSLDLDAKSGSRRFSHPNPIPTRPDFCRGCIPLEISHPCLAWSHQLGKTFTTSSSWRKVELSIGHCKNYRLRISGKNSWNDENLVKVFPLARLHSRPDQLNHSLSHFCRSLARCPCWRCWPGPWSSSRSATCGGSFPGWSPAASSAPSSFQSECAKPRPEMATTKPNENST